MITTISLSPAIDKRLEFDTFALGGTNRVAAVQAEGAGKAVNVALGARTLGMDAVCAGILPFGGEPVTQRLACGGVRHDFLPAPGNVRINQKLFDRSTGVLTEANESCPPAPEELLVRAQEQAAAYAAQSEFLVLTGSLPSGCPKDYYARVLRRAHEEAPACRCVLDAEGERFALGVHERPWLVKPNRHELELFAGRPLPDNQQLLAAARALLALGVGVAVVSMGAQGALAARAQEAVFVPSLPLTVRTTVGAGDAMVAGLLYGFSQRDDLAWALRCGTASAAARCVCEGEGYLCARTFESMLEKTKAVRI